jgi:anti-anti-sigma factor
MTSLRTVTTVDVDENGVAILGPAGDVDVRTAGDVAAAIIACLADHRVGHLVVDLAQVTFLDMTAMGALLRGRAAAMQAGVTFRVIHPRGGVRRVLDLTGTLQILTGQATPIRERHSAPLPGLDADDAAWPG